MVTVKETVSLGIYKIFMTTPAEAAYLAWVNGCEYITFKDFDDLNPNDKLLWTAIADAVIEQSKTIIAEEMAKALTKLSPISSDDQVRVKRHLKAFKVTQQ